MIAVAVAYPEPEAGGRGKKGPTGLGPFSSELIRKDRLVLREAPEEAFDPSPTSYMTARSAPTIEVTLLPSCCLATADRPNGRRAPFVIL